MAFTGDQPTTRSKESPGVRRPAGDATAAIIGVGDEQLQRASELKQSDAGVGVGEDQQRSLRLEKSSAVVGVGEEQRGRRSERRGLAVGVGEEQRGRRSERRGLAVDQPGRQPPETLDPFSSLDPLFSSSDLMFLSSIWW